MKNVVIGLNAASSGLIIYEETRSPTPFNSLLIVSIGWKIASINCVNMLSNENESSILLARSNPKESNTQLVKSFSKSSGAIIKELVNPLIAPLIAPIIPSSLNPSIAPLTVSHIVIITVSG